MPAVPVLRTKPPTGAGWSHEVKFDGWRAQLIKEGRHVRILTRRGHDATDRFRPIAEAAGKLRAKAAILDGELVALNAEGWPSFEALGSRSNCGFVLWAFDLLHLNGRDLRPLPLQERRRRLMLQLERLGDPCVRFSESFDDPIALLAAVERIGGEGIVSKRLDAPYRSGNSGWIKVKTATWRAGNRERWQRFGRGR